MMTLDEVLARLDCPRKTAKGWTARCPAHDDRHPSLSVRKGDKGVLLHCWSGCTVAELCAALGITQRELFYATDQEPSRRTARREQRPERPEDTEYRLWASGLGLQLRALAVFDATKGCDTAAWSNDDFDRAMRYVSNAHDDLRQAEVCYRLAFRLRGEIQENTRASA